MNPYFLLLSILITATVNSQSSKKIEGKIVPQFGQTFAVPTPDFKTDTTLVFKAVFDVAKAPEDPSIRNPYLETLARFLNMHQNAGVPAKNLKVRAAIHGGAAYGLLKNEYYKEKYGVDNPNIELLKALDDAGVDLILCGQTAGSRDISTARRLEIIDVALSAMTILIQSQEEGYHMIAF